MKPKKVLQIASHKTNIGDGANIMGFQTCFIADMRERGMDVVFLDEEIMEYKPHLGKKDFNSKEFIDLANSVDLIVIGGGGFFSAFKAYANSGCHVDFTFETLDQIKTPIIYYALGFSTYYGQKYYHIDRLQALLEYAGQRPDRFLVSVRNDGSYERLQNFMSPKILESVQKIADAGFFIPVEKTDHIEIEKDQFNVVIQLAGDKATFRFLESNSVFFRVIRKLVKKWWDIKDIRNEKRALKALARISIRLVRELNAKLVLCPHIYKDLSITEHFVFLLPEDIARFHVKISGVYNGKEDALKQFDIYRKADLILGMRFHSNVCSFGMGVPSIGLVTHSQIDSLYQDLESTYYVHFSDKNLERELWSKISKILQDPQKIKQSRLAKIQELREINKKFHFKMIDFLQHAT